MSKIKLDGIEIEVTPELIKAVNEAKHGIPEDGQEYWTIGAYGIESTFRKNDSFDKYRLTQNNIFRTYEEAKMAEHRNRLHNTPSTDVKGENYWYWGFKSKSPVMLGLLPGIENLDRPCFATKEECEAWGEGYGELKGAQEVYEYFYNLKK